MINVIYWKNHYGFHHRIVEFFIANDQIQIDEYAYWKLNQIRKSFFLTITPHRFSLSKNFFFWKMTRCSFIACSHSQHIENSWCGESNCLYYRMKKVAFSGIDIAQNSHKKTNTCSVTRIIVFFILRIEETVAQ